MVSKPRPTLRCAREDLTDDWGVAAHQRLIAGELDACPPFSELDHPVVSHAVATFSNSVANLGRESISGLTNPMWYRLRTGRWRGAVLIDGNGQAWICAAGLRRGGESSDFYAAFMADVQRNGPSRHLPTELDHARLALEEAEVRLQRWEEEIHKEALAALETARHRGSSSFEMPNLQSGRQPLSRVTVEVTRLADGDIDEGVAEIVVTVSSVDYSSVDLLERGELIVLAAICPDEQSWTASHAALQRHYSLIASQEDVERLVAAAADPTRRPGQTRAGTCAHYAHKHRLTDQYVDGTATRALCGTYFVPRQDPDGKNVCPGARRCTDTYRRPSGIEVDLAELNEFIFGSWLLAERVSCFDRRAG